MLKNKIKVNLVPIHFYSQQLYDIYKPTSSFINPSLNNIWCSNYKMTLHTMTGSSIK